MNNYLLLLLLVFLRNPGDRQTKQRTLAKVPYVIGDDQKTAEENIRKNSLNPVSESIFIEGEADKRKGTVVDQEPKEGFVPLGTDVKLTVSSGAPSTPEDDLAVHLRIEKDVEAAKEQILVAQNKIEEAKATILAAIEAKDNTKTG